MNYCQKGEFLLKLVHRDLEDCYQCLLECSREYVFNNIRGTVKKKVRS